MPVDSIMTVTFATADSLAYSIGLPKPLDAQYRKLPAAFIGNLHVF
jgi:hypothetical protein